MFSDHINLVQSNDPIDGCHMVISQIPILADGDCPIRWNTEQQIYKYAFDSDETTKIGYKDDEFSFLV